MAKKIRRLDEGNIEDERSFFENSFRSVYPFA